MCLDTDPVRLDMTAFLLAAPLSWQWRNWAAWSLWTFEACVFLHLMKSSRVQSLGPKKEAHTLKGLKEF